MRRYIHFRYKLGTLLLTITLICAILAIGATVHRRAGGQRRWLSQLESLYGNQPWVAIRYRGFTQYESPLGRSYLFDAFVPVDEVKLFTASGTDDVLESIPKNALLTRLILIDTDISDRGIMAIAGMHSLETLTITDTNLSGKAMSALLLKSSLRHVHFKACRKRFSEYEDEQISAARRPGLDVVWD